MEIGIVEYIMQEIIKKEKIKKRIEINHNMKKCVFCGSLKIQENGRILVDSKGTYIIEYKCECCKQVFA